MVGIYLIFSIDNPDKIYVGSSINIESRIKKHFYHLKKGNHSNQKLQRYVNKYGINKLDYCNLECMNNVNINILRKREEELINKLNATQSFNISSITIGATISKEGKEKISKYAKERQSSKEYKEKLSIKYSGTNSINSKLSKDDIKYIKENANFVKSRYNNIKEIAEKLNVNRKTIYRVLHNKTYKRNEI